MARAQPIQTPQGTYVSVSAAARAHHIDKRTVLNYLARHTTGWQWLTVAESTDTDLSWAQYRTLTDDQRESRYQAWCRDQERDPQLQSTADDFVCDMPETVTEIQDTELDLDIEDTA